MTGKHLLWRMRTRICAIFRNGHPKAGVSSMSAEDIPQDRASLWCGSATAATSSPSLRLGMHSCVFAIGPLTANES
jgi:hypothetical protein